MVSGSPPGWALVCVGLIGSLSGLVMRRVGRSVKRRRLACASVFDMDPRLLEGKHEVRRRSVERRLLSAAAAVSAACRCHSCLLLEFSMSIH